MWVLCNGKGSIWDTAILQTKNVSWASIYANKYKFFQEEAEHFKKLLKKRFGVIVVSENFLGHFKAGEAHF